MVIAVDEHLRLSRQHLGDALTPSADRRVVGRSHRLAQAGRNAVFQKVVELPHQQRHIESSVEGDTTRLWRRRPFYLKLYQLIDRLAVERFHFTTIRMATGLRQREVAEIFQKQSPASRS